MKKIEAEKLVNNTFTQAYDETRFRAFIHNLFHNYEGLTEKASSGSYIPEAFREGVVSFKRLAKFVDLVGLEVDVLAVKLASKRTLENARTMQRNFVARYLNGSRGGALKDAALVAFYAEGTDDWRFSLVRMDYILDEKKQKVRKELTPARRYSFLVGHNEGTHTARRQWLPVLQSSNEVTLAELEDAFNIETVTKEFFERYKSLYLLLKEALDQHIKADRTSQKEFELKGVETADFAKRLLGQIVFLYFLQKKGWLGVQKGQPWGTGSKDYLQRLYKGRKYKNFFNDVLEHLFYDALATERQTQDHYYAPLDCKIPFLNGGLFEPFKGYAWDDTDILLDNKIFEDIFSVFDLYNFTVREDEPLDKEVAVDPEMLGKVFENLIPENERKGNGTYYTPREIVHYMCQESLINYLDTVLNIKSMPIEKEGQRAFFGEVNEKVEYRDEYRQTVPREDIEAFIHHGDSAQEHDTTAGQKRINTAYKGDYNFKIPASIREHAEAIDKALADVKVCDPAIGSGAFPLGIMNEIVRARGALNAYLGVQGRSPYDFKRHAIQSTIYGVDIEPSAVDIAKLRLWLSLVVDEDDFGTIKPLPNLDYKIVTGNSLLGFPFSTEGRAKKLRELTPLKEEYFNTYSPSRKAELQARIKSIIQSEYDAPLTEKSLGYKVDFDFRWSFFEVFDEESGFDILIANPPYVSIENFAGTIQQKVWKKNYDVFAARGDIYCLFYEQGFHLLKQNGSLCFITSNKFFRAAYGKKMREFFTTQVTLSKIIDFRHLPVFDATAYPAIISALNKKTDNDPILQTTTIQEIGDIHNISHALEQYAVESKVSEMPVDGWVLAEGAVKTLLQKVRSRGTPLKDYVGRFSYGIKTGLNEAFAISEKKKSELLSNDPKSDDLIKPWLRGKDIKKWHNSKSNLFAIIVPYGFHKKLENYPAILNHLKGFEDKLRARGQCEGTRNSPGTQQHHWLELDNNPNEAFIATFSTPKITWGNLATSPKFTYDETGAFISAPANIIPTVDLALLGILNSPVCHWLISLDAAERSGGYLEFKPMYVGKIPIPDVSDDVRENMSALVRRVLDIKKQDPGFNVSTLETKINSLVYKSYNLTPEEIAIIEASIK